VDTRHQTGDPQTERTAIITGSITVRTVKDGTKRYDANWRAVGRQKHKTFTRRKAAEKFLANKVKAVADGTYTEVRPALMKDVFDGFVKHVIDADRATEDTNRATRSPVDRR
jgi:hypothetical protein